MGLTESQKLIFAKLLLQHRDVILGPFSPSVTRKTKDMAWETILQELQPHGVDVNVEQLRHNEFDKLKRGTIRRWDKSRQSGEGGKKLSETDELILDFIGRKGANLTGMDVDDDPPVFKKPRSVSTSVSEGHETSIVQFPNTDIFGPPRSRIESVFGRPKIQVRVMPSSSQGQTADCTSMPPPNFVPPLRTSTPFQDLNSSMQSLPNIDEPFDRSTPNFNMGSTQQTGRVSPSILDSTQISESTDLPRRSAINPKRRLPVSESLFNDYEFKELKKKRLLKTQEEQDLRIKLMQQQLDEAKKNEEREDAESKLRHELLLLDIEARKAQISKDEAITSFMKRAENTLGEARMTIQLVPSGENIVLSLQIKIKELVC